MIEIRNLHKRFGRDEAVSGINLSVPPGSAFALVGPNGAGKTTTIRVLMNILAPEQGCATVLGVDSRRLSPCELGRIGYVSESQQFPGRLTVGQYLDYLRPFYDRWDRSLEGQLIDQLQLPLERKIGALSHGMRVKLALACALPFRPQLLVLDEPFSGLDALVREEFMRELVSQAGEMTILVSSHELPEIEGLATHIAFIEKGRVLFQEEMEALQARTRAVRVTLTGDAIVPPRPPTNWIELHAAGSVLSFIDIAFVAESLPQSIAAVLRAVRHIDVQPVGLRSIFTALARARRQGNPT
jgi:ABC-2 type transport system ATP-binding protein